MLNKNKAAMSLGIFLGLVHAAWAVAIWMGAAQKFMNWMLTLHMVYMPYKVLDFDISTAITLVIVTFASGYIFGWVFAAVWNKFRK